MKGWEDLMHLLPLHGKPFFTSLPIACAAFPLNDTCHG